MLFHSDNKYILVYRLENEQGESRDYINGQPVIIPDGYYLGYMNPIVYRDKEYMLIFRKYKLIEYLLFPTALTYLSGEVLFRQNDVISKSEIGI